MYISVHSVRIVTIHMLILCRIRPTLQVDRTLDHFKDNDIDALLEEESTGRHAYPLRVRAAESRSFATVDDNQQGRNSNKPKLLTIYELPDDNDVTNRRNRRRNRSRSRNRGRGERQESGRGERGNRRTGPFKVN